MRIHDKSIRSGRAFTWGRFGCFERGVCYYVERTVNGKRFFVSKQFSPAEMARLRFPSKQIAYSLRCARHELRQMIAVQA